MTTATRNGAGAAVGAEPASAPEKTPWERLREPFPPERIGHLPPRGGVVLDYVGHADVTDRLLSVDPQWNWEPLALEDDGMPRFVLNAQGKPVGLWIRLTVSGVTRLGFGSVKPDAYDAEKQLIGDALRNAAMRFGVALDLWRKEEAHPAPQASREAVHASVARPAATPATVNGQRGNLAQRTDRIALQANLMAMEGQPRMTILKSFGYRGSPLASWLFNLDEDVVAKLARAIAPGNEDVQPQRVAAGDVDPDDIPF